MAGFGCIHCGTEAAVGAGALGCGGGLKALMYALSCGASGTCGAGGIGGGCGRGTVTVGTGTYVTGPLRPLRAAFTDCVPTGQPRGSTTVSGGGSIIGREVEPALGISFSGDE